MDQFAATRVFATVVETGGFSKAAERLGISASVASRQIGELESLLNARLLQRTTRRLSLTETGRAYYERAVQLLADWEEMTTAAANKTAAPRGTLKLTAAIGFGTLHLAPLIARYRTQYPEVRFDCNLTDRTVDLIEEGVDLAIRIGEGAPAPFVARRIGAVQLMVCASPDYLAHHGTPATPQELGVHHGITYEYVSPRDHWRFRDRNGTILRVAVPSAAHTNLGNMAVVLAMHGVGICYEPDFLLGEAVASGALVPLLRDWWAPPLPIHAVYPSRRHLSAKVRSFVDFLAAELPATLRAGRR